MLIPTGSSDISKLYETKGSLMTQKADLLKQDLETRNKIDEINKQVIVLDGKLSKLINPTEPKEPTGAIEMVNKELGLQ